MSWPKSNISDSKLGIRHRWFTGREWADGTAAKELNREFNAAFASYKKLHLNQRKENDSARR